MTEQLANAVLMIRPSGIDFNPETALDNHFQKRLATLDMGDIRRDALDEFHTLVSLLRKHKVEVVAVEPDDLSAPDAVFPNNWVSFHSDGSAVLYPMLVPSRRRERSRKLLDRLSSEFGFELRTLIDLTHLEETGAIVEGTGSLVLDRHNRIVYAAISQRSTDAGVREFCREMNYEAHTFSAGHSIDGQTESIYHTNVLMCLGSTFVVVCLESICNEDRADLCQSFESHGKEVIEIYENQMRQFAGNMLQLRNIANQSLIVMSSAAYESLTANQIDRLSNHGKILHSPIPTIEACGGGSVRCMLAEIFLPKNH